MILVNLQTFLLKVKLYLNSNNLYQKTVKLQKNRDIKHVFEESILSIVNTKIVFAVSTLEIFHGNFCLS